jgi:hypothetical protein
MQARRSATLDGGLHSDIPIHTDYEKLSRLVRELNIKAN